MATPPSIFQTASLLVGNRPGNVPIDAATMKKLGYSYVATQGVEGAKITGDPDTFTQADWDIGLRPYTDYQDYLRAAGLKSIPWQKLYGGTADQVKAEAQAAATFISRFKPDGFQINPETEYKEDGRWRSRVYVDALKAALVKLGVPLNSIVWAIQPLGGAAIPGGSEVSPWTFSYDTAPWLELPGCFCLPETYWTLTRGVDGASPDYRPLNCADAWLTKLKWPVDRFGFTLGWWNDLFATPEQYFADLALVKQRFPGWKGGYGIYLADMLPVDMAKRFAAGIARGFAASAPTPAPTPAPPPAPTVDSVARNRNISIEAHLWLDQFLNDPKPLSRLRLIDRISRSTDAQWTAVDRAKLAALLDMAGVPKT